VTGARVERVSAEADGKIVHATVGGRQQRFPGDEVLVATGRRANTELLALDRAGVKTDKRGQVTVDPTLRTSNPRVFAAGDVTPAPQFVYVAAAMGAAAAENTLTNGERTIDYSALPITFTSPQIRAVGLTEEQADEQRMACSCRTLPLGYVPRALVERDTCGMVKIVIDGRRAGSSGRPSSRKARPTSSSPPSTPSSSGSPSTRSLRPGRPT
jgi:mercuric reductase